MSREYWECGAGEFHEHLRRLSDLRASLDRPPFTEDPELRKDFEYFIAAEERDAQRGLKPPGIAYCSPEQP